MKDPDLNLLYVLEAMLKLGNLSRAATSLGLSQSGMSHALERLRRHFGDPLFIRSGGAMKPTARCEQIAPIVLPALAQMRESLSGRAHFDAKTARRTFNIILTDSGELTVLPGLIRLIGRAAPECNIRSLQVAPADVYTTLESGKADIALGHTIRAAEGLYQKAIGTYSFVCLYDKKQLAGKAIPSDEAAYVAAQHIVVSLSGDVRDSYEHDVRPMLERHRVNVGLIVSHWVVVPDLLLGTRMVATLPLFLARHGCRTRKSLAYCKCPLPLPVANARQLWHPRYHQDAANVWLRGCVNRLFPSPQEEVAASAFIHADTVR